MTVSICFKHDVRLTEIGDIQGVCPVDGEVFVLSGVSEDAIMQAFPSASIINEAYNPVMGGSSIGHIKEIMERYK